MQEQTLNTEPDKEVKDLTITDTGILAIADRADRLVTAMKIIRAAVLKLTNEQDWENLGDKPYLNEGGAKKVGTAFGVSWQFEDEPQAEEYDDGHYSYTVSGKFLFRGSEIDELGTASSRDPFFSRAKGVELPPSEINRNNVRKKAITNCIGRGVKGILALKNYTWDEVHAAGIDKEKIRKVDYKDQPVLPNYGEYAKQPISSVPTEGLKNYLDSLTRSLTNPKAAQYKASNQRTKQAIEKVLADREADAQTKAPPETAKTVHAPEPETESPDGGRAETDASRDVDQQTVYRDRLKEILGAASTSMASQLYNESADSGKFTSPQLKDLQATMLQRMQELQPAGKKR